MNSKLSRLLELNVKHHDIHDFAIGLTDDEQIEMQLLEKEIEKKLKDYDSLTSCHDEVFDLGERKYWDIKKFGNFFKVETRMEYSKEECERIIYLVIRAFQMNLELIDSENSS